MKYREIDALVAKALGWHRYDDPNGEFLPDQGWDHPLAHCGVLPEFSTDPAASDALLEEMRKRGWAWAVYGGPAGFSARFFRDVFDESAFSAGSDDSPRRAICEAALKALGVGAAIAVMEER